MFHLWGSFLGNLALPSLPEQVPAWVAAVAGSDGSPQARCVSAAESGKGKRDYLAAHRPLAGDHEGDATSGEGMAEESEEGKKVEKEWGWDIKEAEVMMRMRKGRKDTIDEAKGEKKGKWREGRRHEGNEGSRHRGRLEGRRQKHLTTFFDEEDTFTACIKTLLQFYFCFWARAMSFFWLYCLFYIKKDKYNLSFKTLNIVISGLIIVANIIYKLISL